MIENTHPYKKTRFGGNLVNMIIVLTLFATLTPFPEPPHISLVEPNYTSFQEFFSHLVLLE